jgi:hypothetical protein
MYIHVTNEYTHIHITDEHTPSTHVERYPYVHRLNNEHMQI